MLAALLLFAAQAAPEPTPEAADARCLVALAMMADLSAGDAKAKEAGLAGTMFYLGKILARNPQVAMARLMTEAAAAIGSDPRPTLTGCSKEIERAGQTMVAAGAAMAGKK